MADSQLTFKENDIAQLVNSAYEQLRSGDFGEASDLLERALELDVEYEGITAALKGPLPEKNLAKITRSCGMMS